MVKAEMREWLNSSLGTSFALVENFGGSTDSKSSFIPKFSTNTKTSTAITSMVASLRSQILRIVANAEYTLDSANLPYLVN